MKIQTCEFLAVTAGIDLFAFNMKCIDAELSILGLITLIRNESCNAQDCWTALLTCLVANGQPGRGGAKHISASI